MKSATMSKQSEKEREFSSDFQNASEFRGDFQSEMPKLTPKIHQNEKWRV